MMQPERLRLQGKPEGLCKAGGMIQTDSKGELVLMEKPNQLTQFSTFFDVVVNPASVFLRHL